MGLIPLSGLLKVASAGVQGYGEDKDAAVKQAIVDAQQHRQAQNDAIENLLKGAQTKHALAQAAVPIEGSPEWIAAQRVKAGIGTDAAVDQATRLSPITTQTAVNTATRTAPISISTHNAEQEHDASNPAASFSPVVTTAPGGAQHVSTLNTKTGALTDTGVGAKGAAGGGQLAAPMAAKVGQFGEMLKKAHDLTTLTDNLDVTVGQSATRDLAEHGLHIPLVGTLPGSKGIGSMLQSHSPEYSQYQAALSPFILAAAHALSGARINQDQVEQIRKSIELAPGDFGNKAVRAQKEKNMIDLINSIGGSLPKDAIGEQEGQMDEASLAALSGRGYRRIGGQAAAATAGKTIVVNGKTFKLPP